MNLMLDPLSAVGDNGTGQEKVPTSSARSRVSQPVQQTLVITSGLIGQFRHMRELTALPILLQSRDQDGVLGAVLDLGDFIEPGIEVVRETGGERHRGLLFIQPKLGTTYDTNSPTAPS
jgi:hypothetical protein